LAGMADDQEPAHPSPPTALKDPAEVGPILDCGRPNGVGLV
jgi:hypothetical protein